MDEDDERLWWYSYSFEDPELFWGSCADDCVLERTDLITNGLYFNVEVGEGASGWV